MPITPHADPRPDIVATLDSHLESIRIFHAVCFGHFKAVVTERGFDHKPPRRRPSIGFRIARSQNGFTTGLAVRPAWNRRRKTLDTSEITIEMFTETPEVAGGQRWIKLRQDLEVVFRPDDSVYSLRAWRYSSGTEAAGELVRTIDAYLADPEGTLTNPSSNCNVCGRALTDDVSRLRGFGPECVRKIGMLVFLTDSILKRGTDK